ncbi:MAG: hypothetical protein L0Y71_15350 [Gemmataceae bacterium]|nr:hypothetical protein [Gemmataceae bacterium]
MGIDVTLQSERGEPLRTVSDPRGLVVRLLREVDESDSRCLRFVDPYGDATFNRLQMPCLIQELQQTIDKVSDPAVRAHGGEILELAKDCERQIHLYLKFVGD